MGSDKQYHGWSGRGDWDEARKPKRDNTPETTFEERKAYDAASSANGLMKAVKNVLNQQLPLFRQQGKMHVREYSGVLYAIASETEARCLQLFTEAGLALEQIQCRTSYNDDRNLQDLKNSLAQEAASAKNPGALAKKLNNQSLKVALTSEQLEQLQEYYRSLLDKPGNDVRQSGPSM